MVTEGGSAVVWASGKFHKSAMGVMSAVYVHAGAVAKANGMADAIAFSVGPGVFAFDTSCSK